MGFQTQPCCCGVPVTMMVSDFSGNTAATRRLLRADLESGATTFRSPVIPLDAIHVFIGSVTGYEGESYIVSGKTSPPVFNLSKINLDTAVMTDLWVGKSLASPRPGSSANLTFGNFGLAIRDGVAFTGAYESVPPGWYWYLASIDLATGATAIRTTEMWPITHNQHPGPDGKNLGFGGCRSLTFGPDGSLYGILGWQTGGANDPALDAVTRVELWRIDTTTGGGTKIRNLTELLPALDYQHQPSVSIGYDADSETWFAVYRRLDDALPAPARVWKTSDPINGVFEHAVDLSGEIYDNAQLGQWVFAL